LNGILKTPAKRFSVFTLVKIRLISFALILAAGFILVVSLAVNAAIVGFGQTLFSNSQWVWSVWIVQTLASLVVVGAMFALIFKTLPDEKVGWWDAIAGALVAALLFSIGKSLIGIYLGNTMIVSSYGAAGTFILILVWVYYSSLIFLFGAEVTQAWRCFKKRDAEKVIPKKGTRTARAR
jgi:membrane protein